MPRYTISMKGAAEPHIPNLAFSSDQMTEIGEYDVGIMKDRIGELRDVYDEPTPPLTQKYARRKVAKGLPPERDLTYSGIMLRALQVLEADETHVTVGLRGSIPFRKALFNQNIDPWFGMSDRDEVRLLDEKIYPVFEQNLAEQGHRS